MAPIPWRNIKLLIVDLDNTLCDTFHTLSKPQWKKVERALEEKGWGKYSHVLERNFGKRPFRHVLESSGMTKAQVVYAIKIYDKVDVRPLTLFNDAKAILNLKLKKVLLSRGEPALQKRKIVHLKLRKHFDDVVIVNTFDDKLASLKRVLRKYHAKPSQALIIGDRLEEEIADGKRLGIPTVLVRRPGWPVHKSTIKADLTVRSLASVAKRLKV